MNANFQACLDVILESEGGYTVDQGGPTNLGVTQKALSAWLGRPASIDEVKALTPATVAPLYEADYYNAAHANECPAGVDLMVFDQAVNEGVGRAIRHLQQALGVPADGAFGPQTRGALQDASATVLIGALHDINADYYDSLASTYPQFERGWHARNDRTRDAALAMRA